jgi:molybdopterin molybdotransferase
MNSLITVAEAKEMLQKNISNGKKNLIPIQKSNDRILAVNLIAPMDVPSFDNSAMDGYAIGWDDSRQSYEVVGQVAAGEYDAKSIKKGEAVRIFTGAPIPLGADTVIQQEKITRIDSTIQFQKDEFKRGASVRLKGTQCKKGQEILLEGTRINPGSIALLASLGISEIEVFDLPKLTLIVTGNELREIGEELNTGQIYNSSGPAIEAYLASLGIRDISIIRVADEFDSVVSAIQEALDFADFTLITGGISVGDFDFVKEALVKNEVEEIFYTLSQRPGKPLFAGKKDQKMIFALPGNPASVLTCFLNYVKPSILQWSGHSDSWNPSFTLPLAETFSKSVDLTLFLKAKITNGKVYILPGQESFNLLSFGEANGLVEIPKEADFLEAGAEVSFYSW